MDKSGPERVFPSPAMQVGAMWWIDLIPSYIAIPRSQVEFPDWFL